MQEKLVPKPNAQRTAETKQALMAAARRLIMDQGFAETGTPQIVRAAKATRGALYHHFADKTDLFRAILWAEAQDVSAQIEATTQGDLAPIEALTEGAASYFDAMAQPGRARLLLVDGPAILGAQEMEQIDSATGGEELRQGLRMMIEAGLMDSPLEATADLLSAMIDRAALAIAAGQPEADYKAATARMIHGLVHTAEAKDGATNH